MFDNSQWPGNSPDLNPTENLGAIIKDRVEQRMMASLTHSLDEMRGFFSGVMNELSDDATLLQTLLKSMKQRIEAVVASGGGPTRY